MISLIASKFIILPMQLLYKDKWPDHTHHPHDLYPYTKYRSSMSPLLTLELLILHSKIPQAPNFPCLCPLCTSVQEHLQHNRDPFSGRFQVSYREQDLPTGSKNIIFSYNQEHQQGWSGLGRQRGGGQASTCRQARKCILDGDHLNDPILNKLVF